ncbi:MAG: peptidylprolyl isomerase [Thermodesulfobacteriota bacterium]|nr:peptidylprolyl isomerase [Thermodesulfobacteriota bacterium]
MIKKIIVAGFIVLLCRFQVAQAGDETGENVLAQVGDERLTARMFELKVKTMPPELKALFQGNTEKKQGLIDRWVEITLLAKEAEATGIAELPEIKSKINEYKKQVLAREFVTMRLKQTTSIPEQELKKYYDSHPDEFMRNEQIRASHIMIAFPAEPTADEEEQAQKTIFEIRERLLNGESFADQAKTFSDDPNTKDDGGDLGFFERGAMLKEFEEAAFKTQTNSLSEPFRTRFGWHILKTTARMEPLMMPFQEVRKELEAELVRQRNRAVLDTLISELRVKYNVIKETE